MTRAKTYRTEHNFLFAIGPKHLRTAVQGRHTRCVAPMSALGKQTFAVHQPMSVLPLIATTKADSFLRVEIIRNHRRLRIVVETAISRLPISAAWKAGDSVTRWASSHRADVGCVRHRYRYELPDALAI